MSCLTDKTLKDERIILIENKKVVSKERELAKIFNEYFLNTVSNVETQSCPNNNLPHDPVLNATKEIWKPPSILEIKKQLRKQLAFPFSFRKFTLNETINEIKGLDKLKSAQSNDIPTKVIKKTMTFLLLLLLETLLIWSKTLLYQFSLNKQIWSEDTKIIPGVKRKITGL